MTQDHGESESITIPSTNEGPTIPNSYGSVNICQSYIHVVDLPDNDESVHHTEENSQSEETDLSDSSSGGSVTPLPIDLLPGEKSDETADFLDCRVVLTNFRLCILSLQDQSIQVISLMSIESLNFTDPNHISIVCKDGKWYRLTATSNELAIHWHKRLMKCTARADVGEAFAWDFAEGVAKEQPNWLVKGEDRDTCEEEWSLLGYNPDYFKISDDNKDHSLIETYPTRIIVPKWMEKKEIEEVREYRFLGRIPAIVYVYNETKAVLLRSSQPKTGFLSWKCKADERILIHVNEFTKSYQKEGEDVPPPDSVILDARSYAAAWANRAKGGGFENPDCYGNAKSMFLGLPNIHSVRYAFSQLRTVLSSEMKDQNTYLQSVSQTQWLQHLGNLMNAANECMDLLQRGTSILVHCSDGWDRTTQIVSLAKLFIDERYRTLKGFELLIRREWIEFGHKFADRNGVYGSDTNERCPVFLQWLDAVWQASKQYPTAFEFNSQYIIKLAQHVYSGLFGTFLFNSIGDAVKDLQTRMRRPVSIWQFLGKHNEEVVNQTYDPQVNLGRLNVKTGVQDLTLWKELYFTEWAGSPTTEISGAVSSPSLARSAASTPIKDMPSLQKSKSSESINSIGTSDPMQNSIILSHPETNGVLNGIEHHPSEHSAMNESSYFKRDAKTRSSRGKRTNVKDLVDYDGMIKFLDPAQEFQRKQKKNFKEEKEKLTREKEKLTEQIKRDRTFSEGQSSSLLGDRLKERMISGEESELDNMSMDRTLSDASLEHVESSEVPLKEFQGWVVGEKQCALCRLTFSKLSYKQEEREHHCRKCGKAVCGACSPHVYHEPYEGKGVNLRACVRCYQQMKTLDESINEQDEENGGEPQESGSEDIMRRDGESFVSLSNGSYPQSVKG